MRNDDITTKLDLAVQWVTSELSDVVMGMFLMGSMTAEATATSDLDVIVLLRDEDYNRRVGEIQRRLTGIAQEINGAHPRHELVLWASKFDHYFTFLPDVSYVRGNLPDQVGRLDAWCGLAKHTLLHYECSSAERLFGEIDLEPVFKTIPRSECLELFLLTTRTLAEGLMELYAADPAQRRSGINHVAKAGIRAVYAVLVHEDQKPRIRYSEIASEGKDYLPNGFQRTLEALYRAKVGEAEDLPDLADVLALFRYCEERIADTGRMSPGGLTIGRGGESYAFQIEDITGRQPVPIEGYRRFPGFGANYLHALYFLMSAQEIVKRSAAVRYDNPAFLDFFFEELTTAASFAVYNPDGIRILVGRAEGQRSSIDLHLGRDFLDELLPLLVMLAEAYFFADIGQFSTPWLSQQTKLARLTTILNAVSAISTRDGAEAVYTRLAKRVNIDAQIEAIVDWQLPLLNGVIGARPLCVQVQLGLTLFQAGKLELAKRLIEGVIAQEGHVCDAAQLMAIDASNLASVFSQAHQYLANTLLRMGEVLAARSEYEAALERDPDNYSAADDYASFLLEHERRSVAVDLLNSLPERCRVAEAQVREQIGNRMHNHAIHLKQAGDLDASAFWYQRTIEFMPDSHRAHNNYGLLKKQQGDVGEAAVLFQRAIELKPDYLSPYINIALLFEDLGQFGDAIQVLTRTIELGIANENALTNLANCHLKRGDMVTALLYYDQAIALKPDWADALAGKGTALLRGPNGSDSRMIAEAAALYRRAYEVDSTFEEARVAYEHALALLAMLP